MLTQRHQTRRLIWLLALAFVQLAALLAPRAALAGYSPVTSPPTGTAGTPASAVLSVQGVSNMTPLAVALSTPPQVNIYGLGGNEAAIDTLGNVWTRPGFQEYANLSAAALNADLLPATDVSAFRSWSIEIVGTFVGTITPQCSNDNVNWIGATMASSVDTSSTLRNNIASTSSLSSVYSGSIAYRYLRIRMTGYTSGTATGTAELNTYPLAPQSIGAAISNTPAVTLTTAASGGLTPLYLSGLGAPTLVKSSAGQIYAITISNTQSATPCYVQVFNAAATSAVTLGTTVPSLEYYIPSLGTISVTMSDVGVALTSGIVMAATTADKGATVSAAGVIVSVGYK